MSNNGGITSQKYFAYQRVIFIIFILRKISSENEMVYEGTDDIEIYNIISSNICVQVKGGDSLSFSKVCAVLTNWMNIFKDNESTIFQLVCENSPSNNFSDISFDTYYNECKNHVGERSDSKYSILFSNYPDEEMLRNQFKKLKTKILETEIIKIEELDSTTLDAFKTFTGGSFNSLDEQRVEELSRMILSLIENNVLIASDKTKITIGWLNKTINEIAQRLPKQQYRFKSGAFRCSNSEIEELINKTDSKLVRELKNVSNDNVFLVNEIRNELEYEFFRDLYFDEEHDEIDRIERSCYSNYLRAYTLFDNPKDIYDRYGNSSIQSNLLMDTSDSRYGCANYLASSNNDNEELKITWEK